jgi:NAD(P)-dependent dehydrogenase (short-subunit alcohol dehydrogenase family)
MDLGLNDKVAVITGGASGIGRGIAEGLAQEGVSPIICDIDDRCAISLATALSNSYNIRASALRCDVTKIEDIENCIVQIEQLYGRVDILVNNAGKGSEESILDENDAKWQYYWDLHVMAPIRLSRKIVPLMRKNGGGVILNIVSICGRQPCYSEPIYNVTKAALGMLTKCMAKELVEDGIRVNCVNPGYTMTPSWDQGAQKLAEKEDTTAEEIVRKTAEQDVPLRRFALPAEIADVVVFLCSSRASYCLGSTYYVDGGWLRVVV